MNIGSTKTRMTKIRTSKTGSMNIIYKAMLIIISISYFCNSAFAETSYEVTVGISQFALDVDQKFGTQVEDDSSAASFSFAAYRESTENSAWGAVLEYSLPVGRDKNLPGNGHIVSFRPVNYLFHIDNKSSIEPYAGLAQYNWIKKANGYVFGFAYRYKLFGESAGLMADFKYYQDLAYDSPQGDDIVDGFNSSLKFFYHF